MARSAADKEQAAAMLAEAEANTKGPVLSPERTLILFALAAREGFIAQNDLGVAVGNDDREALDGEGLLTAVKREHNALWLKLTDEGWSWIAANMNKAVPPSHSVVHHLMNRIAAHLDGTGAGLKGFMGEAEPGPMDPELAA